MNKKILFSSLIIFFVALFIIFYDALKNTNIYSPNTSFNKSVPVFKAKIFESEKEKSSKEIFSNDNFYLVNIWSSWCVPCREEHRFLMRLKENRNIEIVGLNYKDKQKNAKKFLNELRNPYQQILLDEDGTISIEWGAYGVPESFLIHNKKIIKKIIGPLNENSVSEIERLLK